MPQTDKPNDAGAEKALEMATAQGWTVISMKDAWSVVFADAMA